MDFQRAVRHKPWPSRLHNAGLNIPYLDHQRRPRPYLPSKERSPTSHHSRRFTLRSPLQITNQRRGRPRRHLLPRDQANPQRRQWHKRRIHRRRNPPRNLQRNPPRPDLPLPPQHLFIHCLGLPTILTLNPAPILTFPRLIRPLHPRRRRQRFRPRLRRRSKPRAQRWRPRRRKRNRPTIVARLCSYGGLHGRG